MNRRPNHSACPRCGSRLPQDPAEILEVIANDEQKELPDEQETTEDPSL
jgi:hypothetical protein